MTVMEEVLLCLRTGTWKTTLELADEIKQLRKKSGAKSLLGKLIATYLPEAYAELFVFEPNLSSINRVLAILEEERVIVRRTRTDPLPKYKNQLEWRLTGLRREKNTAPERAFHSPALPQGA